MNEADMEEIDGLCIAYRCEKCAKAISRVSDTSFSTSLWMGQDLHRVREPPLCHDVRPTELKAAGLNWIEVLADERQLYFPPAW